MIRALLVSCVFALSLNAALAQEQVPTANAPAGAPQVEPPQPAPDTVAGPGKDRQSERKAIFDRMRECMKDAKTKAAQQACREEMRKHQIQRRTRTLLTTNDRQTSGETVVVSERQMKADSKSCV